MQISGLGQGRILIFSAFTFSLPATSHLLPPAGGLALPASLACPGPAPSTGKRRRSAEEEEECETKRPLEDIVKEVEELAAKEETLVKNNPAMAEMVDQALSRNTRDLHSTEEEDVVIIEDEKEERDFYTMRLEHAMPDESHYDPVNQPNRDRWANRKWNGFFNRFSGLAT